MKRYKWIFVLILTALVVVVGFVIMRNNRRSAVDKYKAELRAKGEKISFAELGFPRTPEKPEAVQRLTNALNKIVSNGFVNAGGVLTMSINYVAPGKAIISWRDGDDVGFSAKSTNLVNWAKLQAQCTGASNELAEIRTSLEIPFDYLSFNPEDMAAYSSHTIVALRSAAQWLYTDALCALHRNDRQTALEDLHAMTQLCRFNKADPQLVSQMIRLAITGLTLDLTWEMLQHPRWTEQEFAAMQQDWQLVNLSNAIETGLLNSRATSEWMFNRIRSNGFKTTMRSVFPSDKDGEYWEQIKGLPASFIWNLNKEADELLSLHQYQSALESARDSGKLPWSEVYAREIDRMDQFYQTVNGAERFAKYKYLISAIAIPNLTKPSKIVAHHESFRRLTITAIALKRFQLRHEHFPSVLNELVPEFISAVPIDPMNVQPLSYKLNADGTFVLYSVGEDGRDDGGDPTPTDSKSPPDLWNARDAVWPAAVENTKGLPPGIKE